MCIFRSEVEIFNFGDLFSGHPYLHFTSTPTSDSARTVALASVFCYVQRFGIPAEFLPGFGPTRKSRNNTKITGVKS